MMFSKHKFIVKQKMTKYKHFLANFLYKLNIRVKSRKERKCELKLKVSRFSETFELWMCKTILFKTFWLTSQCHRPESRRQSIVSNCEEIKILSGNTFGLLENGIKINFFILFKPCHYLSCMKI